MTIYRDVRVCSSELDDTDRLVHYEGAVPRQTLQRIASDMESQMYPPVERHRERISGRADSSKPFICCEYTHAMGNSCGAMHKYTDLTDTEPTLSGRLYLGLHRSVDLRKRTATAKEFQAYGGDFGERPTDYNFQRQRHLSTRRRPRRVTEDAGSQIQLPEHHGGSVTADGP